MIEGIAWLNIKMGVFSIILPIIFASAVIIFLLSAYRNPSRSKSNIVLLTFAIIYLFGGVTILLGKDFMGFKVAFSGAVGLWIISLLLVLDIIFHLTFIKLSKKIFLRIVSVFLIFSGIFLYPILETLLGFMYPKMVFIGAECPTTITLIGILIGSIPRVNKVLFILVSLQAIVVGLSVAFNGAVFDYLYALAGFAGLITMVVYFRDIFFIRPHNK